MGEKKHQLTLLGATSYIVGTIIGSGIFVSPKGILRNAGSVGLSLIIWVLCAGVSLLQALNYIELGTSIPESGSDFAYISYVGWIPVAFSFLWLATIILSSCSGAVYILTFGKYIGEALSYTGLIPDHLLHLCVRLFGIGLIILLTFINFYPISRYASKLQVVSMFAKVTVLLLITGIGIFSISSGHTQNLTPPLLFNGSNWSPSKIVSAIYQGNWAYSGFSTLNYGTEEIDSERLNRILPRAVIAGIVIPTFVYVCANVAYFSVLSPSQMLASEAVATTFVRDTLGLEISYVMPALVGLLLIGTLNGHLFTWSRFMMAGARRGMMPSSWSLVHPKYRSPRVALVVHTLLAILFSFFGDVEVLVDWLTVTAILCTISSIAALILIKWRDIPVSPKAVKFHIIIPIISLIMNIVLFVTPIIDDPWAAAIGMAFFLGGIGCYYLVQASRSKTSILHKIDTEITRLCQLVFWSVPETLPPSKDEENAQTKTEVDPTSKC